MRPGFAARRATPTAASSSSEGRRYSSAHEKPHATSIAQDIPNRQERSFESGGPHFDTNVREPVAHRDRLPQLVQEVLVQAVRTWFHQPLLVQSGGCWLRFHSSGVECLLPLLIEADPHNYAGPHSPDPRALSLDLDPVTAA